MKTSSTTLLMCRQLEKRFGAKTLFKDFSFAYPAGVLALVGKNGAGKSTLISMLCGLIPADSGAIVIAGHDLQKNPVQAKQNLAYVPDEPVAYDFMTGFEYLMMICSLRGINWATCDKSLLSQFEVENVQHQPFKSMSLGTQRKFMLIGGLLAKPQVLIMDEPTNGLDFKAKETLIQAINAMRDNKLIFFSSHDQAFIEATKAQVLSLDGLHAQDAS